MPNSAAVKDKTQPAETPETEQSSNTDPIKIVGLGDDVVAKVDEIDQHAATVAAYDSLIYEEATNEHQKREFVAEVLRARQAQTPKEYVPPPVPEAVVSQTNAEIAAGRAQLAKHQNELLEQRKHRPPPSPRNTVPEGSVEVFRPEEYVPSMNKGSGPTTSYKSQGG